MGGQADGNDAAERVVGEASWAVMAAGEPGGCGQGGRGEGEERVVLAGMAGHSPQFWMEGGGGGDRERGTCWCRMLRR